MFEFIFILFLLAVAVFTLGAFFAALYTSILAIVWIIRFFTGMINWLLNASKDYYYQDNYKSPVIDQIIYRPTEGYRVKPESK